jgi:hypothetical protein
MSAFLMAVIGGTVGIVFLSIVVLSGLRVIKVKVKVHKALGLIVLGLGIVHGAAGILLYLGVI